MLIPPTFPKHVSVGSLNCVFLWIYSYDSGVTTSKSTLHHTIPCSYFPPIFLFPDQNKIPFDPLEYVH